MVILADPPPQRAPNPRWLILPAGTHLIRIYKKPHLAASSYNYHGPRGRFDHHEPGQPRLHADRGVYYAASTLAGCVVEVFGDTGVIERTNRGVAKVELQRDCRLLDLTGIGTNNGAWKAGTVAAIMKNCDHAVSQRWAAYFYETYPALHGLKYENAHNADIAFVLFERVGALSLLDDRALTDPSLDDELYTIADSLGLTVE